MSFVFVAGINTNWCQFAEKRLHEMGLSPIGGGGDNSLTLDQFTQKLCKAYKVSTERSTKFRQVNPGRAWQIQASSIIIDNSEKSWCWADRDNLFFLDFWKEFDPLSRFVLLYGSPSDFLALNMGSKSLSAKREESLLAKWKGYHEELLRFYHENNDRSILVHISALENNAAELGKLLISRFEVDARLLNSDDKLDINPVHLMSAQRLEELLQDIEIIELRQEIENSADLLEGRASGKSELAMDAVKHVNKLDGKIQKLEATNSKQESRFKKKEERLVREIDSIKEKMDELLKETEVEKNQLLDQLQLTQEKYEANIKDKNSLQKTISDLQRQVSSSEQLRADEEKLLIAQLHQVQEELEFYFKKSLELEKSGAAGSESFDAGKTEKTSHTPSNPQHSVIDFRGFINGDGWHSAEESGRWAGPSLSSKVTIKNIAPSNVRMELRVLDGMSVSILAGLRINVNGNPIKTSLKRLSDLGGTLAPLRRIKARLTNVEKPYPAVISANIPKDFFNEAGETQVFEFISPSVKSPLETGENDSRELSLLYEKMILTQI